MRPIILAAALALAACGSGGEGEAGAAASDAGGRRTGSIPQTPASGAPAARDESRPAVAPSPQPIASRLILQEWSRAENRAHCVTLAFTDDGGAGGTARRANFAGGWAVAFDLPGRRSAYGLAGVGDLPDDTAPEEVRRRALIDQWPAFRDLAALPQPAYAGYGIEGARAYGGDDPQGVGAKSLAYVRVGGQRCLYNVWSTLGRAHLETLLDGLRVLGIIAR